MSPAIKSLYDRDRKLIHILAGETYFGPGVAISGNLSTGEATGAHLTGAREQGLYTGLGLLFMSVNRKLITKTIASVNLTHYIYYIH